MKYIFKHALTQEVAYGSALQERRKALHEKTAQAVEVLYRTNLDEHYSDLAHHYVRSGNTQKAVEYLGLAGQQAARHSANADAINHFTTALELFKTLPDTAARARQELILHLSLGALLMATKGFSAAAVEQTDSRAQELCLQVGEPLQVAQVLFGLFTFNATRGNHTAALALGEQFLPVADRQQDPTLSLVAHAVVGDTLLWRGEFARAQAHLDQAGAPYDPEHHRDLAYHMGQDLGLAALGFAAQTLWCRGYSDQALARARHVLSLAQALAHPFSLVDALGTCCLVHLFRREGQEAHAHDGGITDTRSRARVCIVVGRWDYSAGLGTRRACRAVGCPGAGRSRTGAAPGGSGCFADYRGRDICPTISGRGGPGLCARRPSGRRAGGDSRSADYSGEE